jgi:hypothetical protein
LLEEERKSETPIAEVAETAAEVADVAEELHESVPEPAVEAAVEAAVETPAAVEEAPAAEPVVEEEAVKVDPVPVADAETVHDHVKLDQAAYESTEPTVAPAELAELAEEERKSDTPITEVAETAAEVADIAEKLHESVPEPVVEEQEFKVSPLPASENVPQEFTAEALTENVKLDQEAYESSEPTVAPAELAQEEEQEVKVSPLPASDNTPQDFTAEALTKNVKLDQAAYESTEPTIAPAELAQEERKSDTPIAEVAETAAEVADVAEELHESVPEPAVEEQVKVSPLPASDNVPQDFTAEAITENVKLDQEAYESSEPIVAPTELAPEVVEEAPKQEEAPKEEAPKEEAAEVAQQLDGPREAPAMTPDALLKEYRRTGDFKLLHRPRSATPVAGMNPPRPVRDYFGRKLISRQDSEETSEGFDKTGLFAGAATVAVAAGAAAVAVASRSGDDKKTDAALKDESVVHHAPHGSKVTEAVDESTVHRKAGEELITEPAPQAASSAIHGDIVPESEVPKIIEESKTSDAAAPIVIASPPADEASSSSAATRTVEVVKPNPSGELFAHSVWNQSVSPLLQYSLENTSEGIRQRKAAGTSTPQNRPTSSGSDIVSARTHRNIMQTFWQVFFFGWLGGVGRFFGSIFQKKKKNGAAGGQAGRSS